MDNLTLFSLGLVIAFIFAIVLHSLLHPRADWILHRPNPEMLSNMRLKDFIYIYKNQIFTGDYGRQRLGSITDRLYYRKLLKERENRKRAGTFKANPLEDLLGIENADISHLSDYLAPH